MPGDIHHGNDCLLATIGLRDPPMLAEIDRFDIKNRMLFSRAATPGSIST